MPIIRRAPRLWGITTLGLMFLLLAAWSAAATSGFATYDKPASWEESSNSVHPDSRYAGELHVSSYSDSSWESDGTQSLSVEGLVWAIAHDSTCGDCQTVSPFPVYTSFEDFVANAPATLEVAVEFQPDTVISQASHVTLSGMDAYLMTSETAVDLGDGAVLIHQESYWLPTANGGIGVQTVSQVSALGTEAASQAAASQAQIRSETDQILSTLSFATASGATGANSEAWRTVVGGAAALAAAAAALVGAFSSSAPKDSTRRPDPNAPIGYVLQLSSAQLTFKDDAPPPLLTANAYAVFPDGSTRPAPHVPVVLSAPPAVQLSAAQGSGQVASVVSRKGQLSPGSQIQVQASSELGSTSAVVKLQDYTESRIVARFEPHPPEGGFDTVKGSTFILAAAVQLNPIDASSFNALDATRTISFSSSSNWLNVSTPAVWSQEMAVRVGCSQPDPSSLSSPPEAALDLTAWVGQKQLQLRVPVPLAALPSVEVKPGRVELVADSGSQEELQVWVENPAGDYEFTTSWRNGPELAQVLIEKKSSSSAALTLTEASPAGDSPHTTSTLVVAASCAAFDPVERHVDVIVSREGLFVRTANADPSTGAFWVRGDGTGVPGEFDLQAFVLEQGKIVAAPDLALSAKFEYGPEGSAGAAGLESGAFEWRPSGVRPVQPPSATFSMFMARKLPTGPDPLSATLQASIEGYGDPFRAVVPLRIRGVDSEPFSDSWNLELERCHRVINEFVPQEYRAKLNLMVNERATTFGTEGLYALRHQLWSFAQTQLVKQAHDHLDQAWWYEQVEGALEWASWCSDIALGVLAGVGPYTMGATAMAMLKPFLVEAVTVWVQGGSLDEWLVGQSRALTGLLEGIITDPDLLAKLPGESKVLAWVLYVSYYFTKELMNAKSVTQAMEAVSRQLRDELLTRFLRKLVGSTSIPGSPSRANATTDPAVAEHSPSADTSNRTTLPEQVSPPAHERPVPPPPVPERPVPPPPAPESPARAPDTPNRPAPEGPEHATQPDTPERSPHETSTPDEPSRQQETSKPDDSDTSRTPEEAPVPELPKERPPKTSWPEGEPRTRAESMASELKRQAESGKVDPRTVESIMRDPDAMRILKKEQPDLWQKFHEVRNEFYERHDSELGRWIEENVPEVEGHEVLVETFGTKDGVDRDYRAGYVITDSKGQKRFIEIPREYWQSQSEKIFAKHTGGPTDSRARQWGKEHQQLATDYTHPESSIDMADQATIWNEKTGQWDKTQMESNLHMTERGRSTLLDPKGLGDTYRTKVMESYRPGHRLDAYRQAAKSTETLSKVTEGYTRQGYQVPVGDSKLTQGVDIVRRVDSGELTPAQGDAQLTQLDYQGGLPGFMQQMVERFASFENAQKAR